MVRRLLEYLPHIIRNVREYKAILDDAEQEEILLLWGAVDTIFNDQFVSLATLNGVQRWEAILNIRPKGTDLLDARKFRIISRLNEQLPYSLIALKNMLQTMCGENGYSVEVHNESYLVKVRVALEAKSNYDDAFVLLKRVIPANMVIELSLKYNTHQQLQAFTHEQLQSYTHEQLRNEVL